MEENNGLNDELKDEFAQLEKEQSEMVNNMSQSIKSDIEKGKQVKNQIVSLGIKTNIKLFK